MRPEAKIALGIGAIAGLGLLASELSRYSFSHSVAQEILKRDRYTCTGVDRDTPCVLTAIYGKPASSKDGFFITASHYNHSRRNPDYNSPRQGHASCVCCHAIYERKIGHDYGYEKMLECNVFKRNCHDCPDKFPLYDPQLDTGRAMLKHVQKTLLERRRSSETVVYEASAAK